MKRVIEGTVLKGLAVFVGILVISTVMQLMIYVQGVDPIMNMITGSTDEKFYRLIEEHVHHVMGMDKYFWPDLWPLDNESLWRRDTPE